MWRHLSATDYLVTTLTVAAATIVVGTLLVDLVGDLYAPILEGLETAGTLPKLSP